MTIEEFGQQIKSKYPQYQDLGDSDIGQKMLTKYPQYRDLINTTSPEQTDAFLSGHPVLKSISDFVGTTGLGKGIAQGIFLKFTPEGKELLNQVSQGKLKQEDVEKIIGKTATTKEILGSALKTATSIGAVGITPPATVAGRLGVGAGIGATLGTGQALEENQGVGGVVKGAVVGAGIGLATTGLFEAIGAGLRKISQSNYIQKRAGTTLNKELQPPIKEVSKDIEKGFKTFGEQAANVVDDSGKPIYTGTYNTLLNKSKQQLTIKGESLISALRNWDKANPQAFVNKNEVASGIINAMENNYGRLTPSQIKAVNFEVSRMPKTMSLEQLEGVKRMYDGLIPETFWSKLDDPAQAFPSLVKYYLRDNARKIINDKASDIAIQKLNNEMSIAMDVKKLAATQIAKRTMQKISGQGGYFYKLIGRFIDDYIFNPAITTKTTQALRTFGGKTGQTLPRQLLRTGITKGFIDGSENEP